METFWAGLDHVLAHGLPVQELLETLCGLCTCAICTNMKITGQMSEIFKFFMHWASVALVLQEILLGSEARAAVTGEG